MRTSLKEAGPWLALLVIAPALAASPAEVPFAGVDGVSLPVVKARTQIAPFYPAMAQMNHAEGVVTVAATIEANGKVSAVEVVACEPAGMGFEIAASEAVRHWRFEPSTKDGESVASKTFINLHMAEPVAGAMGGSSLVRASLISPLAKTRPTTLALGGGRGTTTATSSGISTASHGRDTLTRMEKPPCTRGERCLYDRTKLNWKVGDVQPTGNGRARPTPSRPRR